MFYALAGRGYLPFLGVTILSVYGAALLLGRSLEAQKAYVAEHRKDLPKEALNAYKQREGRKRSALFVACLLLDLGLLAALKYTSFVLEAVRAPYTVSWVLPLGISFYTFQSVGYLMDVKRGKYLPERNILRYALFASFFPQMIQGPISRYDMLSKTLYEGADFDGQRLVRGLVRILWGASKKLIVADRLAPALALLFGADAASYKGGWVLLGMVLYALRLYADFTGGIDMALGVGELFGVVLPENFDRPYLSKNIEEYWTRWHMTMGSWFRDYLFYPLNVSKRFLKWTKALRTRFGNGFLSRMPLYASTLIVWLATGVWHGAGWNFALWGLTNGAVIIISLTMKPLYDRFHGRFPTLKATKGYGVFEILRTFLLMCLIRLWDCYAGPGAVGQAFWSLFTTWNYGAVFSGLSALGLALSDWIVLLVMAALMLTVSLMKGEGSFRAKYFSTSAKLCFAAAVLLILCLLLGAYGPGYAASDFIYGQF